MASPGPVAVFGVADVPLFTADEAAETDRRAREEVGIPEAVLMENAGRAAALLLERLHPRGVVVVVTGRGNNGADGLVLARTLRSWGRDVAVLPADGATPDRALLHGWDVPLVEHEGAAAALAGAGVLVDALLGTGARGAARPPAEGWIRALNGAGPPIVALDLPSGVDATTGAVPGEAIRATTTICFGWPKVGLLFHPARASCGRLMAVEIGFPPPSGRAAHARLITPDWAACRLPARAPGAHKGTAGHALLLAGDTGMAGAAGIAARAALAAGAGLVSIASAAGNRAILQGLVPAALFRDRSALDAAAVRSADALVAGPGAGQGEEARQALQQLLAAREGRPLVLDADALNVHEGRGDELAAAVASGPAVLTPHPKELARLLARPVEEVTRDAAAAAREAAARFGCVVLLKGQPSVVACADSTLLVNTTGSSDLATGGMGDHLAGTVGAFLAAGTEPAEAAALGLFFGGRAADLAALGRSLSPDDLSAHFAAALAAPGRTAPPAGLPFVTFDQPPRR